MSQEKLIVQSRIQDVPALSSQDRTQMFDLMSAYFDGVDKDVFLADLEAKQWVIVLTDRELGRILGFSTLAVMTGELDGREFKAFYSGDTIIDHSCRKLFSLEREWVPFVFSQVAAEPDSLWYWFMVCKGFRTYRYLPVYFKTFWPSPDATIPPFEQKVVNLLAWTRFGDHYDPERGLVRIPADYRLKRGVGDVTEAKLRNRYIRFFVERNPGWQQGDELACLVQLQAELLNNKVRQLITAEANTEKAP